MCVTVTCLREAGGPESRNLPRRRTPLTGGRVGIQGHPRAPEPKAVCLPLPPRRDAGSLLDGTGGEVPRASSPEGCHLAQLLVIVQEFGEIPTASLGAAGLGRRGSPW